MEEGGIYIKRSETSVQEQSILGQVEDFCQSSMSENTVPKLGGLIVPHKFKEANLVVDNKEHGVIFADTLVFESGSCEVLSANERLEVEVYEPLGMAGEVVFLFERVY